MLKRQAGILLPVSSLPGQFGIGDFGPKAYRFVDFLQRAGQSYWEILPLLISDRFGSPFASVSAMAVNWLMVSPELLVKEGLLKRTDLPAAEPVRSIYYRRVEKNRSRLLGKAWECLKANPRSRHWKELRAFQRRKRHWLDDYCLYQAIKRKEHNLPWFSWPVRFQNRNAAALQQFVHEHDGILAYFSFEQWIAHKQWQDLKTYANRRGIKIIGSVPFYVTHDSVDVWAHRDLFQMSKTGKLQAVAGVPPDHFNQLGQRWGNPLYDWQALRRTKFAWTLERFSQALRLYDLIILDHFRGYRAYWQIPASSPHARRGRWIRVPSERLFSLLKRQYKSLPIIAEDLGVITPAVHTLREHFKIPGFRVLQRSLQLRLPAMTNPPAYPENAVVFTGTYDMPTLRGWFNVRPKELQDAVLRHLHTDVEYLSWNGAEAAMHSPSALCIVQLQDYLGLDDHARINRPGTVGTSWMWRMEDAFLTPKLSRSIQELTKKVKRL